MFDTICGGRTRAPPWTIPSWPSNNSPPSPTTSRSPTSGPPLRWPWPRSTPGASPRTGTATNGPTSGGASWSTGSPWSSPSCPPTPIYARHRLRRAAAQLLVAVLTRARGNLLGRSRPAALPHHVAAIPHPPSQDQHRPGTLIDVVDDSRPYSIRA
jgi:hypothetical protein